MGILGHLRGAASALNLASSQCSLLNGHRRGEEHRHSYGSCVSCRLTATESAFVSPLLISLKKNLSRHIEWIKQEISLPQSGNKSPD